MSLDLACSCDRVCALSPSHAGLVCADNKSIYVVALPSQTSANPALVASGSFASPPPRLVELWPSQSSEGFFGAFVCIGADKIAFASLDARRTGGIINSLKPLAAEHVQSGQLITALACTANTLAILSGGSVTVFKVVLSGSDVSLVFVASTGPLKQVPKTAETVLLSISPENQDEVIVGCHSRNAVSSMLLSIRSENFGAVLGSASASCADVRAWCADWRSRRLVVAAGDDAKQQQQQQSVIMLDLVKKTTEDLSWSAASDSVTAQRLVDFVPGNTSSSSSPSFLQLWQDGGSCVRLVASPSNAVIATFDAVPQTSLALCSVGDSAVCVVSGATLRSYALPTSTSGRVAADANASSFASFLKDVAASTAGKRQAAVPAAEVVAWLKSAATGAPAGGVLRDGEYLDGRRHAVLDQVLVVPGKKYELALKYFSACTSLTPQSALKAVLFGTSLPEHEALSFILAVCSIPRFLDAKSGVVAAARTEVPADQVLVLLRRLHAVLLVALASGAMVAVENVVAFFDGTAVAHALAVSKDVDVSACVQAVVQLCGQYAQWALTDIATGVGALSARCSAPAPEIPKESAMVPVGARRIHTRTVFGIHREIVPLSEGNRKVRPRSTK